MELESLKVEYTNAQLECNAADERAKLLASEVIGLEEKVVYGLGKFLIDVCFPIFYFFGSLYDPLMTILVILRFC